jgi:hypothetical protein
MTSALNRNVLTDVFEILDEDFGGCIRLNVELSNNEEIQVEVFDHQVRFLVTMMFRRSDGSRVLKTGIVSHGCMDVRVQCLTDLINSFIQEHHAVSGGEGI